MDLLDVPSSFNSSLDNASHAPSSPGAPPLPPHSRVAAAAIVLVVGVVILGTLVGNVLVVVAVFTSRALRAPQNLFLVSLASADILVATLVIPFSLANEVMGYWYFGALWCSFYLSLDVLFCTSSIVHLCAISLDRYWSVTEAVSYNRRRTPQRIKGMISVVWLISFVISSPPLFMTQKETGGTSGEVGGASVAADGERRQECLLMTQTWYVLSSCLVSFFAPGIIMILVYCRIYRVAKQRAATVFVAKSVMERQPSQSETCFTRPVRTCRRNGAPYEMESPKPAHQQQGSSTGEVGGGGVGGGTDVGGVGVIDVGIIGVGGGGLGGFGVFHHRELDDIDLEERRCEPAARTSFASSLRFPRRAAIRVKAEERREGEGNANRLRPPPPPSSCSSLSWASSDHCSHHFLLPSPPPPPRRRLTSASRAKVAQMREKRFTFVLAVVMGVFVLCWFPFFFTYSLQALCREKCSVPERLFNLFFWIGYCNSSLNPLIYTMFNRDFRNAFNKILCRCGRRT